MAARVDFSSIFDNALPMVYVRKVSLSKGGDTVKTRRDPNENADRFRATKNRFGKKKLKSTRKRKLKPRTNHNLIIDVDLMIKDSFNSRGKSTWFDSPDFLKYLKIHVILCKERGPTNFLLKRGVSPKIIKRYKKNGVVKEKILTPDMSSTRRLEEYSTEMIDGKRIYGVPYSVRFSINDLHPEHLSIFAMTVLHSGDISADKYAYSKSVKKTIQGNTMAEIVIDQGEVKKNAFVYTTPDSKIWAGPMHSPDSKSRQLLGGRQKKLGKGAKGAMNPRAGKLKLREDVGNIKKGRAAKFSRNMSAGGYRNLQGPREGANRQRKQAQVLAGAFKTSAPRAILKRHVIPNFIVDDYRLLDRVSKVKIQMIPSSTKEQEEKRKKQKKPTDSASHGTKKTRKMSEGIKNVKKERYISELYIARSPNNRSNFMFQIDLEKLIRFESQYGKLLEVADRHARMAILSRSRIIDLKVYRHRVKHGIRKGEVTDVDFDSRTELIALSSEVRAGNLPTSMHHSHPDSDDATKDPRLIGAIKELRISAPGQSLLRSFSVSDYDMRNRTDGMYQYSLQFQVEDGTIEFAKEQLYKLKQATGQLQQYYNRMTAKSNYNPATDAFKHSSRRKLKKEYPTPSEGDIMSKGKASRSRLLEASNLNAPWVKPIAVYIDTLFNMSNLKRAMADDLAGLLYRMSNPTTGNSTSILIIIDHMLKLQSKIKRNLGAQDRSIDELDFETRGSIQYSSADKPLIIQGVRFKRIFDSDILKFVGYNYLAAESKKHIGLKQLPYQKYNDRARAEHDKHFSRPGGRNAKLIQKLDRSYLTPYSVSLGRGQRYRFFDNSKVYTSTYYDKIVSSILAMKPDSTGKGKDKLRYVPSMKSNWQQGMPTEINKEENMVNTLNMLVLSQLNVTLSDPKTHRAKLDFNRTNERGADRTEGVIQNLEVSSVLGSEMQIVVDEIEEDDHIKESFKVSTPEEKVDYTGFSSNLIGRLLPYENNLFGENEFDVDKISSLDAFNLNKDINAIDIHRDNLLSRKSGNSGAEKTKVKTRDEYLNEMPNQIKSLFWTSKGFVQKNWKLTPQDPFSEPQFEGLIYFNYKMINSVEVFMGYEKSEVTGEMMLSAPRFRLLNREIMRDARKEGRTLLCRMRPYENSILGFKHNKKLSLPIFDEYFVLFSHKERVEENENEENLEETDGFMGFASQHYINRLVDQKDLNNVGYRALKSIIEASLIEDRIKPEYTCTTSMVSQHRGATRFGTGFGLQPDRTTKIPKAGVTPTHILSELFGEKT